jgi:hypothetical protein
MELILFFIKIGFFLKEILKYFVGILTILFLLLYARILEKPLLVISDKRGRLGNRLVTFAHLIAFAIDKGYNIVNASFCEYADWFENTKKDPFCRYPMKSCVFRSNKIIREIFYNAISCASLEVVKRFESKYITTIILQNDSARLDLGSPHFLSLIAGKKIIFLRGWGYRYYSNFGKYADKIRAYFKPDVKLSNEISYPILSLKMSSDIIVGVLIRHGDYRTFAGGVMFYEVEQYVRIMQSFNNLFLNKKIGFFICSDFEQDVSKFADLNFIFRAKSPQLNIHTLALCDYIISPHSTYSSWASFYGRVPWYIIEDPAMPLKLENFKIQDWKIRQEIH